MAVNESNEMDEHGADEECVAPFGLTAAVDAARHAIYGIGGGAVIGGIGLGLAELAKGL